MAGKRVIIVGGVAGGASCAARLRRLDEEAEITMFERGPQISFANCGLPYYVGGVIEDRGNLLLQTPESFNARFNVNVFANTEVVSIDREKRTVDARGADGAVSTHEYDYLVLSPGANPIRPPLPGIDLPGIFTLRNVPDSDAVLDYVRKVKPKKAVVIGGGYIGIEMAENLHGLGVGVAIVEMLPQVMAVFDPEMAEIIHERLHKNGVATWLGDGVASFEEDAHGIKVTLAGGREMTADMVILSVGVRPDVALAKAAGIETGPSGGIKVDSHMRTNDENIFAVGDAVEVTDFVTGAPAVIALAGPANRQGRIAADNISGRDSAYSSTQGTAVVQVFDLTGACTGASERSLKKAGVAYEKIYLHPANHAGYYPGAFQMAMKVLFSTEDGRVLGAQIVGPDGVDKRIDVLATAMRAGMTVWDLEHLELAYAPPYGSAKDPVNMAGFVGASILKGDTRVVHWNDIDVPPAEGAVLLDVRTAVEVAQGDVEGALHIPVDELRDRFDEIPRDARVYVYCAVGIRGYIGERILKQAGYDAYNVSGGYKTLRTARPDVAHGTPGRDMFEELKEHFCSAPTRSAEQS